MSKRQTFRDVVDEARSEMRKYDSTPLKGEQMFKFEPLDSEEMKDLAKDLAEKHKKEMEKLQNAPKFMITNIWEVPSYMIVQRLEALEVAISKIFEQISDIKKSQKRQKKAEK